MTMGLAERLRGVLACDPGRGAVEYRRRWYSWGEIDHAMTQIDRLLAESGLTQGAPIGMLLRNRPLHLAAVLSVIVTRRCVVTLNPIQPTERIVADLRALRPPAVIADRDDWELPALRSAAQELGILGIAIDGANDRTEFVAGLERTGPGPFHEPQPGVSIQMLSSGTTGPAKRIKLPWASFERGMLAALQYEAGQEGDKVSLKNGVALCSAPLVHISGILMPTVSFLGGRAICLMEKFNVAEFHDAVLRHRPKAAPLNPTAIRMVYDANIPKEDLASLVAVRAGTAPLDPGLREAFESRYGIAILESYGATEFGGGVAGWSLQDYRKFGTAKRGSVGRMERGCEARVIDPDTGAVLDTGAVGLLEVRGEYITAGQWVRTTDLAHLDGDGFVFLHGRADDAIIRGGFKVLPEDVARVLRDHPAVADAAVVGLPDPRLGAVPVAAVELHADAAAVTEAELQQWLRERLTAYQVPVQLRILAELPRTPSLKVSRPELRALFAARS
ncbi:MAG: class I adenylate-forming enzyme family protein [Gammaproteobacteria bacterium]